MIHFATELAVIITRGRNGEMATYPVVETVQRNHVCHLVRAPAPVTPGIATVRILGANNPALRLRMLSFQTRLAQESRAKDRKLRAEVGTMYRV